MWKSLFIIIFLFNLQCCGWEYNGDDPQVDAGYIWYNGTEWVDGE